MENNITEKFNLNKTFIFEKNAKDPDKSNFLNFNFRFIRDTLNFAFMTRINHTDFVFMNFYLRFSARHIPVLNEKNKLKFTFYPP